MHLCLHEILQRKTVFLDETPRPPTPTPAKLHKLEAPQTWIDPRFLPFKIIPGRRRNMGPVLIHGQNERKPCPPYPPRTPPCPPVPPPSPMGMRKHTLGGPAAGHVGAWVRGWVLQVKGATEASGEGSCPPREGGTEQLAQALGWEPARPPWAALRRGAVGRPPACPRRAPGHCEPVLIRPGSNGAAAAEALGCGAWIRPLSPVIYGMSRPGK